MLVSQSVCFPFPNSSKIKTGIRANSSKIGCGKTTLVCALIKELILEKNEACFFIEFAELLGKVKAGYDKQESETKFLEELARIPVLILDELGKGKQTDWETSIIDKFLGWKNNNKTTNHHY